jgi:integrase
MARQRKTPTELESRTFRDGAIYLYRRTEYKKPTWYIRLKVPGIKGYIWKSSKTTDEHTAFSRAEQLYNENLVKSLSGVIVNNRRIVDSLKAYIAHIGPEIGRTTIRTKVQIARRLIPVLKSKTFDELNTALISEMVETVSRQSRKGVLSPNAQIRLLSDFRHFLRWAIEKGYTDNNPKFPTIRQKPNRRPHFDPDDWNKLTRYMRTFLSKAKHPSVRRDRNLLVNYVLILANTGIRVGEARELKWRDIRPITSSDGTQSVALMVTGKTGKREVVARTADVKKWFNRILEERKQDIDHLASDLKNASVVPPDSYVFCGCNGKPIGSFKKSFGRLISEAGVEFDSFGQRRTIYSLRHTYATFRLQEGVNHYILAQNMGTSVAMLEQFYGHTSNVTAAAELMKTSGKKGGRSLASGDALDWLAD